MLHIFLNFKQNYYSKSIKEKQAANVIIVVLNPLKRNKLKM